MPVPPCFHLADTVFPRVRAAAARVLVAQGWSQTRAAHALGVSQAMVSKYVAAGTAGEEDPLVARLAAELVQDLERPPSTASPWCGVLAATGGRAGGHEALEDLLAAERLLCSEAPLRLMPQVGLNLVRALPGAKGPQDLLGYPARIVCAGDRLVAPSPPERGASGHLARCLLHMQGHDDGLKAMANVRGGHDVAAALERQTQPVAEVPADAPNDPDARFQAALDGGPPAGPCLVHDRGAVGLEPCLYVAGPDARTVARLILKIHETLVGP